MSRAFFYSRLDSPSRCNWRERSTPPFQSYLSDRSTGVPRWVSWRAPCPSQPRRAQNQHEMMIKKTAIGMKNMKISCWIATTREGGGDGGGWLGGGGDGGGNGGGPGGGCGTGGS